MQDISIGKIYRHYKGNLSKIIAFAKHTDTYMWNEIVDNNGTLRFTLC